MHLFLEQRSTVSPSQTSQKVRVLKSLSGSPAREIGKCKPIYTGSIPPPDGPIQIYPRLIEQYGCMAMEFERVGSNTHAESHRIPSPHLPAYKCIRTSSRCSPVQRPIPRVLRIRHRLHTVGSWMVRYVWGF